MNWINLGWKIGSLIVSIIIIFFYLGGSQQRIETSIKQNTKSFLELKKDIKDGNKTFSQDIKDGNKEILTLLRRQDEKREVMNNKITENTTNIKAWKEYYKIKDNRQ